MPERTHISLPPSAPPARTFAAKLSEYWGFLALIGGIMVAGGIGANAWHSKADASAIVPIAADQRTDHERLVRTETRVDDLAKGLDGVREDLRSMAVAQGHPLPLFTPVATPAPAKTP